MISSLRRCLLTAFATLAATTTSASAQHFAPAKAKNALRIATYNASLNRPEAGKLTADLRSQNAQVRAIATVVRAIQPDILLVNELDYSAEADNAQLLDQNYFSTTELDLLGGNAWPMRFHFSASSNTGMPSGMDLDNNGRLGEPNDAFGFGRFPGQYGMAVFSRFEIVADSVVTLQNFPWSKLPDAKRPIDAKTGETYHPNGTWEKLRLSSKSFWDVPIRTPLGTLHVLASHPTPPAFDGAEDRNGCRNHDEIKLIQYYIESSMALKDDQGNQVNLAKEEPFFILGDLNCDPQDGDSQNAAINALLSHPQFAQFAAPRSQGGEQAAKRQGKLNAKHKSDPAEDTADFNDASVGNLRVDYVLPSRHFEVVASGVFWPLFEDVSGDRLDALKKILDASDHHLVWVDVELN